MNEHIDRLTLEAYAEKALPAVQRQAVEAHMAACPMCQARLNSEQHLVTLLRQMPRERPAPDLAARINASLAARRAPARWMRALVPAAFAMGLVMLALAAPQWTGWVQAAANTQLPTFQAAMDWMTNAIADPTAVSNTLATLAAQLFSGQAEEMSLLLTLALVLLASASVAGLVQLLGESPLIVARDARKHSLFGN